MRSNYKTALQNPVFNVLSKAATALGLETYVIGGFVRDHLLNRGTAKDIDIVTVGSGIALAKKDFLILVKLINKNTKILIN